MHAAGGQVDGVHDVPALRLLGQAGGGPEGEHLVALGRRRAIGQYDQARLGEGLVELEYLGGAGQRAEVQDGDVRRVLMDGAFHRRRGNPVGQQLQVRVFGDQVGQTEGDEILELGEDHADVARHGRSL
ncbi:MAG: hypothetical protein WKF40_04280 [Thermoleophilaceae bacterium]